MPLFLLITAMLVALPAISLARNIDLSTVPTRDTVQLTIYNAEDLTLVRETRKVSFKKGVNPLQFSWAGTLIDPTSVELKFLTHGEQLDVLDTTYPHDKPQMLFWNVQSGLDGEATIEITYFTSGISWSADYVAIANADETRMNLESFVKVTNRSGEDYENAQVRLVVGTINLVEKIAQLARQRGITLEDDAESKIQERLPQLRQQLAKDALEDGAKRAEFGFRMAGGRPKQIIKEGLSEYFIYTIEGTETIPNLWSKRMRSFDAGDVPFKIQYRYRPQQYGNQLVRMYLLTNNKESKLGTTPLPDGVVRVFRQNGDKGLSFLAAQPIKYVPIGDKIEVNLGPDPEVIFEYIKLKTWRDEIWMQFAGVEVLQKVGDANVQIDAKSRIVGWDDHALFTQRIRNYTAKPIEVEVRRAFPGHVLFRSPLKATRFDNQTVEYTANVDAGKRVDLYQEVVTHQGRNHKQDNVTLEDADVKP